MSSTRDCAWAGAAAIAASAAQMSSFFSTGPPRR